MVSRRRVEGRTLTVTLRRRVGDVYVTAERMPDGTWRVEVTDALSCDIVGIERDAAIVTVLEELTSLIEDLRGKMGSS